MSPHIVGASRDSVSIKYDPYNPSNGSESDVEKMARDYCIQRGWKNVSRLSATPMINSGPGRVMTYLCV